MMHKMLGLEFFTYPTFPKIHPLNLFVIVKQNHTVEKITAVMYLSEENRFSFFVDDLV